MGFWGWRQAAWVAFISVLVVACTEAAPAATPRVTPVTLPVTLTLQNSPGAPPVTLSPTLAVVTATSVNDDSPAPALPIEILRPTCTETLSEGYQCIGIARNTGSVAYGTVLLNATLYDGETIIQAHDFVLEQRIVPPETDAPYRLLFDSPAVGPLILSFREAFAPLRQLVMLDLHENHGELVDGDYRISAIIFNPYDFPVRHIRAVALLYAGDSFAGFRVLEFDALEAGAQAEFTLSWYDLPAAAYHHTVAADAFTIP